MNIRCNPKHIELFRAPSFVIIALYDFADSTIAFSICCCCSCSLKYLSLIHQNINKSSETVLNLCTAIMASSVTSTNSNKRRVSPDFIDNPSPLKCRKRVNTSNRSRQPRSKIFSDERDLKQFQNIHEAIECSGLVLTLEVPMCIIREVAECATGMVDDCAGSKCDSKVVSFYADNWEHPSYRSCESYWDHLFFCSSCEWHIGDCDHPWNEYDIHYFSKPDCEKCSRCCEYLTECGCRRNNALDESECCDICGYRLCSACLRYEDEYDAMPDCTDCSKQFCSSCGSHCKHCGENKCTACATAYDCNWCPERSCEDCVFVCDSCDDRICAGCCPEEKRKRCNICNDRLCVNCIDYFMRHCPNCEELVCCQCTYFCEECEEERCSACANTYHCTSCCQRWCDGIEDEMKSCSDSESSSQDGECEMERITICCNACHCTLCNMERKKWLCVQ